MIVQNTVIRDVVAADVEGIIALDAKRGGERKAEYWHRIIDDFGAERDERISLVSTTEDGEIVGFVFGEVRAWEFGSERCGWVFSIAVDPEHARQGLAGKILDLARSRFLGFGVTLMRTMVRRDHVPLASFFRSYGFVAGPYSEMECQLGAFDNERD